MRAVLSAALLLIAAAPFMGGCDDPFGLGEVILVQDTIILTAPTVPGNTASAVDLAEGVSPRRPELPAEAQQWDLQIRQEGTAFSLVPFPQLSSLRGAGLRLSDRAFEDVDEAPRGSASYTRAETAITPGQTFFVQSRQSQSLRCSKFSVLKVLSVSADSGLAHIAVRSNQSCDDERLRHDD